MAHKVATLINDVPYYGMADLIGNVGKDYEPEKITIDCNPVFELIFYVIFYSNLSCLFAIQHFYMLSK